MVHELTVAAAERGPAGAVQIKQCGIEEHNERSENSFPRRMNICSSKRSMARRVRDPVLAGELLAQPRHGAMAQ